MVVSSVLSLGMLTSTLSTLLERNMVAVLVAYQMVVTRRFCSCSTGMLNADRDAVTF